MKVKIQIPSCHSDEIAGRPKLGADRESCQESNLSCSSSPFLSPISPISPIDPLIYHLPNLPQTLDSSPNFTICPFLSPFLSPFSSTPWAPLQSSPTLATSIYIWETTTQTTKAGAVTVILSRPALLYKNFTTWHWNWSEDLQIYFWDIFKHKQGALYK